MAIESGWWHGYSLLGGQPTGHISKAMMRHMETRHIDLEDTESWRPSIPISRWFYDGFMMVDGLPIANLVSNCS
jgi:hypothetical protein